MIVEIDTTLKYEIFSEDDFVYIKEIELWQHQKSIKILY